MSKMNDSASVDLKALEPEGWEVVLKQTLRRTDELLAARRRDPLTLIASWSRGVTISAFVAVAILIPVEVALETREYESERVQTLVRLSTQTALGAQALTGEDLSRALGHDLLP